jgi:site-specific DNA-methyltransferase (adenine-specific)
MTFEKVIIGDATLYLGDCMEVLPTLEKVDAVITDPPYSETTHSNAKSNRGSGHGNKAIDFASMTADQLAEVLTLCGKICGRWLVSTMEWRHVAAFDKHPPKGWEFVRIGVWLKTNPMPQISADRPAQGWEAIAYLHATSGEKKRWNGGGMHGNYVGSLVSDGAHPTGKPLPLFTQFVERFSEAGDIVLDPFMGSGTTGVAAIQMGRKFIGIEREPKYFEIACERIRNAQRQESLFAHVAKPEQNSLFASADPANDLPVNTTLPEAGEVRIETAQAGGTL